MEASLDNFQNGVGVNMWLPNSNKALPMIETNSFGNKFSNWLDPLETIMSSASDSSIGSPLNELTSTNTSTSVVDNATNFSRSLDQSYIAEPEMLSNIKQEEPIAFEDATKHFEPKPEKKRRGPRKRLTAHQKQAHNKIEKRYRININTKIAKLQQIIPWVASEQTAFEVSDTLKQEDSEGFRDNDGRDDRFISNSTVKLIPASKLNKSMILEKAVDYILYLQNNERLYELEVQRLKKELDNQSSRI